MKIFMPPILGIAPTCDVLLFGFTTKFLLLAILITNGIKQSPIKKETNIDNTGKLCTMLFK